MRRRFEIIAEAAEHSRAKTAAAMDRLEREISSSGFLVGDCFTVADLSAAAVFYPVARPRLPRTERLGLQCRIYRSPDFGQSSLPPEQWIPVVGGCVGA